MLIHYGGSVARVAHKEDAIGRHVLRFLVLLGRVGVVGVVGVADAERIAVLLHLGGGILKVLMEVLM